MADEHAFTLIFEASGEVTPAQEVTPAEPDNDTPETESEPEETEE